MKAKGRFLLEGVRENPGQAPPSSGGLGDPWPEDVALQSLPRSSHTPLCV